MYMHQLPGDAVVHERLQQFTDALERQYPYFIGFPAATDFDYSELYPLLGYMLNNIGDPYVDPLHTNHSKAMEKEVVEFFADWFRAPEDDRWGYVTNGGTEGNLYALYVARSLYPESVVYYSAAAHYSVPKNVHILRMPHEVVAAKPNGEMDYDDLASKVARHAGKPAVVVANIGTTMTEAKDDVARIRGVLADNNVAQTFVHSDAALAGIYTTLLEPRHPFDFADGADSISFSGHKFLGSPIPCGVVLVRRSHRDQVARSALYVGTMDTTISGSRNGHTPLFMWYAIKRFGLSGLRKRIMDGLELAAYVHGRLQGTVWEGWRNKQAITVMLKTPPSAIVHKWQLATYEGWSHIVCMPGVTKQRLDAFLDDLEGVNPAS